MHESVAKAAFKNNFVTQDSNFQLSQISLDFEGGLPGKLRAVWIFSNRDICRLWNPDTHANLAAPQYPFCCKNTVFCDIPGTFA